jgi:hypothetical protein
MSISDAPAIKFTVVFFVELLGAILFGILLNVPVGIVWYFMDNPNVLANFQPGSVIEGIFTKIAVSVVYFCLVIFPGCIIAFLAARPVTYFFEKWRNRKTGEADNRGTPSD